MSTNKKITLEPWRITSQKSYCDRGCYAEEIGLAIGENIIPFTYFGMGEETKDASELYADAEFISAITKKCKRFNPANGDCNNPCAGCLINKIINEIMPANESKEESSPC